MHNRKKILLKVTGEIFFERTTKKLSATAINDLANQIKQLETTHQFGIVVGGGNFFRGTQHGVALGMTAPVAHQVGMLATMMNGLILKDLFEQHGLSTSLFCAISCPEVGSPISSQAIASALQKNNTLIFIGGTGNPFFTTDTNAVLRGLQIDAAQIWKGTNVDGIYDSDPRKNSNARLVKHTTYTDALTNHLGIMDAPAFALARQHELAIRVFNIFTPNALLTAAHDDNFGSLLEVQSKK